MAVALHAVGLHVRCAPPNAHAWRRTGGGVCIWKQFATDDGDDVPVSLSARSSLHPSSVTNCLKSSSHLPLSPCCRAQGASIHDVRTDGGGVKKIPNWRTNSCRQSREGVKKSIKKIIHGGPKALFHCYRTEPPPPYILFVGIFTMHN